MQADPRAVKKLAHCHQESQHSDFTHVFQTMGHNTLVDHEINLVGHDQCFLKLQ